MKDLSFVPTVPLDPKHDVEILRPYGCMHFAPE